MQEYSRFFSCLVVLVWPVWLTHTLQAQTPSTPPDPLQGSAIPSPSIAKDRPLLQRFKRLEESIAKGKLEDAEALRDALLNQSTDAWLPQGNSYLGARRSLNALFSTLPGHLKELHTTGTNTRIQMELDSLGPVPDLISQIRIAMLAPQSTIGQRTLHSAAWKAWSRGEVLASLMIASRALPSPEEARFDHWPLILQTATARWKNGEPHRARELLQQYSRITPARDRLSEPQLELLDLLTKSSLPGGLSSSELTYPAVFPRWQAPVLSDSSWNELFDQSSLTHRRSGFHPLGAVVPLVAGDKVLVRSYSSLMAYELDSGKLSWECAALSEVPDPKRKRRSLDNLGFRDLMSLELLRYLTMNQVSGLAAADELHAYFIGDQFIPVPGVRENPQPGSGAPRNQLLACTLANGEVKWQTWLHTSLADVYFLSQPLLFRKQIYLLGESQSQLRLYVLNSTDGKLDWELPLVDLSLNVSAHSLRRYRQLPLLWQDGWLVCPTGAGCILRIDTLTRSYDWATRYPIREQLPRTRNNFGGHSEPSRITPSAGWQRISIVADELHLFLASPDTESLMAMNSATGAIEWEVPRDDGLYLGGLVADKLLIIGHRAVRALHPKTGEVAWQIPLDAPPSGLGLASGQNYLLPVESGKVLLMDVAAGRIVRGSHGQQDVMGNLVQGPGVLLSLTPKKLEVFGPWENEHEQLLSLLKTKPDDPSLLQQLREQMARGGDVAQVIDLLRNTYQQDPRPVVRVQLILALLEALKTKPDDRDRYETEIVSLVEKLGLGAQELRCRMKANLALNNRLDALRAAILLAGKISIEEVEPGADRQTQIRSDRALQGQIIRLLDETPEAERAAMRELLEEALREARDSRDPFVPQRFSQQFGSLDWGQRLRLEDHAKVGIGWPVFRQELDLLELTEHPNRQVAANALYRLGQDLASRSFRHDAARYYRRLVRYYGDVRFDPSTDYAQKLSQITDQSLLGQEIKEGPADPWSSGIPRVSKPKGKGREPFLVPIPVTAELGSLLDRINVSIDSNNGSKLVCQGDWFPGYWEVALPKSRSPLREYIQTYQGWGLGQLLVVKLGTQVHGISLLDTNGEPSARVVWSVDLGEELSGEFEVRPLQNRQGLGESETIILDEFQREVSQVCVVQPGYLCYRDRGEIGAIETSTGRILWRRRNQHQDARITGDAQFVYLLHLSEKQVETVRVVDGVTERKAPLPEIADSRPILNRGYTIFTESKGKEVIYRWLKLSDLQVETSRTFQANSRRLLLDPETLGVLQPNQSLAWFDLTTGRELGQVKLAVPSDLSRVHAWADSQRFYILPSGIPMNWELLQLPQVRGGFQQQWMRGDLQAIDRNTREVVWKQRVDDELVCLTQPRGVPVFLFNYRVKLDSANQIVTGKTSKTDLATSRDGGVIRVLDRRTGVEVFAEQSIDLANSTELTVESNLEDQWIDLHGVKQRIRLEYK